MPVFKSVKDMEDFGRGVRNAAKVAGIAKLAMNPTPLGVGMAVADKVLKKTTGRTTAEHFFGSIQGPATGTGNVGRNRKGKTIHEGGYFRDPEQKNQSKMRAGNYSTGGLVTYNGISDLHTKVCGHK